MQKLKQLVKISSKESFYKLRDLWEIRCNSIDNFFKVTWLFYRHISGRSRNRMIRDVVERLSSISLIEKISLEWKLLETRGNVTIEKTRFFKKTYKIFLNIEKIDFFIILWEKSDWNIILISVFLNYLE
jgi:hypothetical protein